MDKTPFRLYQLVGPELVLGSSLDKVPPSREVGPFSVHIHTNFTKIMILDLSLPSYSLCESIESEWEYL